MTNDSPASGFVEVAKLADIPDPGKQLCELDDRLVVVFHLDGSVFCLDDVCTHDGGPLGEGTLVDSCIACPRHGAKFDVRTGAAMTMPATEATQVHEVQVMNGRIFVRLIED
ncbi:MAG: non-heme iron oxygenase ferredoxin subunit [Planctomycetales bacterium]|nr:non-heme iron oxygenase ferredoxin subunit [Planctomycetales bacterium]